MCKLTLVYFSSCFVENVFSHRAIALFGEFRFGKMFLFLPELLETNPADVLGKNAKKALKILI